MKTYTNVVLDREERETIQRVVVHLAVAFPEIYDDPNSAGKGRKHKEQHRGARARSIIALAQDRTAGTHDTFRFADQSLTELAETCLRESHMEHWQEAMRAEGKELVRSTEPTSSWHLAEVIAEARARAYEECMAALVVVRVGLNRTTPAPTRDEEVMEGV